VRANRGKVNKVPQNCWARKNIAGGRVISVNKKKSGFGENGKLQKKRSGRCPTQEDKVESVPRQGEESEGNRWGDVCLMERQRVE